MPTHKPTELSRIKLKTWTQQPVPMMSEHSAHLTSLPFGFRTWLWRYTRCCSDPLAQASDIGSFPKARTECPLKTHWAIEDQAKNLNWARPYDEWAFTTWTAVWLSHLALALYMLLLLIWCSGTGKRYSNLKETSCLPLLKAGFQPGSFKAPNRQQTEYPLTNPLSYRGSS